MDSTSTSGNFGTPGSFGSVEDFEQLLAPVARDECLTCYLARMLDTLGCYGDDRWLRTWCRERLDRKGAKSVVAWARRNNGHCDCEVVDNASWRTADPALCCPVAQARGDEDDDELRWYDESEA